MRKLDIHNRAQLVVWALRTGLVSMTPAAALEDAPTAAAAPIVPAFLLEAQRAAPGQVALKAEVDAWLAAERGGR